MGITTARGSLRGAEGIGVRDELHDIELVVAKLHARFYERRPAAARATFSRGQLHVTLSEVLTESERRRVAAGEGEAVVLGREIAHRALEPECRAAVESLTGLEVESYEARVDAASDAAFEGFVLRACATDAPSGDDPVRQAVPGIRDEVRRLAVESRADARALRAQAAQARLQSERLRDGRAQR